MIQQPAIQPKVAHSADRSEFQLGELQPGRTIEEIRLKPAPGKAPWPESRQAPARDAVKLDPPVPPYCREGRGCEGYGPRSDRSNFTGIPGWRLALIQARRFAWRRPSA